MKMFISKIYFGLRWRYDLWIYYPYIRRFNIIFHQWRYLKKLRKKDVINVVFFPMNVAMWKYQHLYDLLKQDKRFCLYIFLAPARPYSYDIRCSDLQTMRAYFTQHNVPFVDFELEKGKEPVDVCSVIEPDILFYAQPYENSVDEPFQFIHFEDRLLCHAPYGVSSRDKEHYNNNMRFNNVAWKLYYQTNESKKLARQFSYNHGRNVVVVGYPSADDYILPAKTDPWKVKDRRVKRIIWAPHFTIVDGIGFAQMSNFLNLAAYMRQLAVDYSDKVTIAFKPHPRLYTELVKHPDWGEERAKEYYDFWKNGSTTQLETGDFVDLFKGSDAMIHDCGSFTVDYLYFDKPVLYDNPDIDGAKATANETGKAAYDVHYTVTRNDDIKRFIDDVVLAGNDPLKPKREEYYKQYLLPPNGKSVAQNIYDDLVKSIFK